MDMLKLIQPTCVANLIGQGSFACQCGSERDTSRPPLVSLLYAATAPWLTSNFGRQVPGAVAYLSYDYEHHLTTLSTHMLSGTPVPSYVWTISTILRAVSIKLLLHGCTGCSHPRLFKECGVGVIVHSVLGTEIVVHGEGTNAISRVVIVIEHH